MKASIAGLFREAEANLRKYGLGRGQYSSCECGYWHHGMSASVAYWPHSSTRGSPGGPSYYDANDIFLGVTGFKEYDMQDPAFVEQGDHMVRFDDHCTLDEAIAVLRACGKLARMFEGG